MWKSKLKKCKNIVFIVTGGIGRNIFSTAVIRNLKKAYPDKNLMVVSGCPDIYDNNPNVNRVYGFDKPQHLFDDFIFNNKNTVVIEQEPYRHPDYLVGGKHVVECWCDLLDIECDSTTPEMFMTRNELDLAEAFVTKFNKPVILFQHTGGKTPNQNDKQEIIASLALMYRRGLRQNVVQEVTDTLTKDGYLIASVQSQNQFCPEHAERVSYNIRPIIALLPFVKGVIAIDSFLQHASAALNVPSLVLWAGTSSERLGYKIHTNIERNVCSTPHCHRPNSYVFDVKANGAPWDCPYSDKCTDYTAKEIVDAYKLMKGQDYKLAVKNFNKKEKSKHNCKGC